MQEAAKQNLKQQFDLLTGQIKAKKRELKVLEKEAQELQSKALGWPNPFEDDEWMNTIYLQVKSQEASFYEPYFKVWPLSM